ncbi:hypothetical protein [Halobacillus mangrovi]|uniref:hypothetical protein n=1 Tax=Halobacillus mangrovi TaxID=402384 RepID=UPI001E4592D5
MNIPEKERLFITLHLLTTNVYRSEDLSEEESMGEMVPAVKQMLQLLKEVRVSIFKTESNW